MGKKWNMKFVTAALGQKWNMKFVALGKAMKHKIRYGSDGSKMEHGICCGSPGPQVLFSRKPWGSAASRQIVCGKIKDDLPASRTVRFSRKRANHKWKKKKRFTSSANREVQPQAGKSYVKKEKMIYQLREPWGSAACWQIVCGRIKNDLPASRTVRFSRKRANHRWNKKKRFTSRRLGEHIKNDSTFWNGK